jgi:predicted hotdog family 3-hydroxylacyl-ACP dehydratase
VNIGRDKILGLIPHAGSMCLLDEVLAWDTDSVRCLSHRFAAPDNPLRRADGTLGTASGIEIAAQAMALHGRLTAPADGPPIPGYLVSLRDVHLATPTLDNTGPLTISATRLLGDAGSASYAFTITSEGLDLLNGRATVLFGAGL